MNRISTILFGAALLTLVCCQKDRTERFVINGEIEQADGKMLYLDWMSLKGVQVLDSAKLDSEGKFSLSGARPECYDFYRLRIDDKVINLAVDSTETLTVTAAYPVMATSYQVEGSENCSILRELIARQSAFQKEINDMATAAGPETGTLALRVQEKVDAFKSEIGREYIYKYPDKPCAYYALFMRINGTSLYRPQENRQDAKYFASVATLMDMKYPDAVRTKNLHNVALKGMKATARPVQASDEEIERLNGLVHESGIIEIELPDVNGVMHRLSDLKGKVVLLDFTAFKTDFSVEYNMRLREIYDKYAARGFEIYQVSLDADEHFWMTSSENLPWLCVHDENSLESEYLRDYRVETLPTAFLLNRDNDLVERLQNFDDVDSHVAALL